MIQPVLNNLADFLKTNTTFFKEVYPHVVRLSRDGVAYPATWTGRDHLPLLEDYRGNYGYIRIVGTFPTTVEAPRVGRGKSFAEVLSCRLVVHFRETDGENALDVIQSVKQFLGLWTFTPASNSQVIHAELTPVSSEIDTLTVHQAETDAEHNFRHEDRLVYVDFELTVRWIGDKSCIESDLCLGNLGAINQVASEGAEVLDFSEQISICCREHTYAEAATIKTNGTIEKCLYHITDENIFIWGLTPTEFSLSGWYEDGGIVDAVLYDFDNNEIHERKDIRGNVVRTNSNFIGLFSNPIDTFPFNSTLFASIELSNAFFTHSGYSGGIMLSSRITDLSTVNVSGYTGNIFYLETTGATNLTLAGAGAITGMKVHASASMSFIGTATNVVVEGGSVNSSSDVTITTITALQGSTANFNGGGSHSLIALDRSSNFTDAAGQTLTDINVVKGNFQINASSGTFTGIYIEDSTLTIDGNSANFSNWHVSENSIVTVNANTLPKTNVNISCRNMTIGAEEPNSVFGAETWIKAYDSNVAALRSISGATVDISDCDYCGIVQIQNTGSFSQLTKAANFPDFGRVKICAAVGFVATVTGTAVAGIGANQIALSKPTIVLNGTNGDYVTLEVRGGVWYQLGSEVNYV